MCRLFYYITGIYETVALLVCLTCLCVRQLIHPIDMWLWRLQTFVSFSQLAEYLSVCMLLVSSLFVSSILLQHCYNLQVFFCCLYDYRVLYFWLRFEFTLTVRSNSSWHHFCLNYFHAMRCVTMIYQSLYPWREYYKSLTRKNRDNSK